MLALGADAPRVARGVHVLDAGDRTGCKKIADLWPVVGWPKRQSQHDLTRTLRRQAAAPSPAQLTRRSAIGPPDCVVETPQAPEAGRQRDVRDTQVGLVQELLREMQPARLRQRDWRGAEVAHEQAVKMPRSDAEPARQLADGRFVQEAVLDQPQPPPDQRGGAEPSWGPRRCLGPAAQAWAEAGLGGGCGALVVADVGQFRAWDRAHRTAIDAGRGDGDEELAIEARIAADPGPVEGAAFQAVDEPHCDDDTLAASTRPAIFGRRRRGVGPFRAALCRK